MMSIHRIVLALSLAFPMSVVASDPPEPEVAEAVEASEAEEATVGDVAADTTSDAEAVPVPAPQAGRLPAMTYFSSIASDKVFDILKRHPALSGIDKELAGSPLTLVVTHTLRPTAGGQAAGFLTAVLAGSTLGLIPMVSNEMLVLRYEVMLNGKTVTSYSFERTATRAMNLWSAGRDDGYEGLGKAGMEWVESTATEVSAKLAGDPALDAVRREIEYYFPPGA